MYDTRVGLLALVELTETALIGYPQYPLYEQEKRDGGSIKEAQPHAL
jgi:hypothetical protein